MGQVFSNLEGPPRRRSSVGSSGSVKSASRRKSASGGSLRRSKRRGRVDVELDELDKKLDAINAYMAALADNQDSRLYSDIYNRIVRLFDQFQGYKRSLKNDSKDMEKVRYLETRAKDYLHKLLEQDHLYGKASKLDACAVESESFIAATGYSPSSERIKGLEMSLERKQPLDAGEMLEEIESNVKLLEIDIETALQLQQSNLLVVAEKKLKLNASDLEKVNARSNRKLWKRKEVLASALSRIGAAFDLAKEECKKIERARDHLRKLEGDVSSFAKTKSHESYGLLQGSLRDVGEDIRGLSSGYKYVIAQKCEILDKARKLAASLDAIADNNKQHEIEEQIAELRKLEDSLRSVQLRLMDQSACEDHATLKGDLVRLHESLERIEGIGAHMQHKQVMMQVIQSILQQLDEKSRSPFVKKGADRGLGEMFNALEELWTRIRGGFSTEDADEDDLQYSRTLLACMMGEMEETLKKIDAKRNERAAAAGGDLAKAQASPENPEVVKDTPLEDKAVVLRRNEVKDIDRRVTYVQSAMDKETLSGPERQSVAKTLTDYKNRLSEIAIADDEPQVAELAAKIDLVAGKLEDNARTRDRNELKRLVEELQRLKRKAESFAGSYKNTLYLAIEGDLRGCEERAATLDCAYDAKLGYAKGQLLQKIARYLRVLEERSTKDHLEVDYGDDAREAAFKKNADEIQAKTDEFAGTSKQSDAYRQLENSLKSLGDSLESIQSRDKKEELSKALRRMTLALESKLQRNYLNEINDEKRNARSELEDVERGFEGLKGRIEAFSGLRNDEEFASIDDMLIKTFARLDKVDYGGDLALKRRRDELAKEVTKYDKLLEERCQDNEAWMS